MNTCQPRPSYTVLISVIITTMNHTNNEIVSLCRCALNTKYVYVYAPCRRACTRARAPAPARDGPPRGATRQTLPSIYSATALLRTEYGSGACAGMSAPESLHTFAPNGRGRSDCLLLGGDTCHSTEHSFPGLLPACVAHLGRVVPAFVLLRVLPWPPSLLSACAALLYPRLFRLSASAAGQNCIQPDGRRRHDLWYAALYCNDRPLSPPSTTHLHASSSDCAHTDRDCESL